MRQISLVHVEVNCVLSTDADFAAVTRGWFQGGVAFFPELFDRLQSAKASGTFVDQPRNARMSHGRSRRRDGSSASRHSMPGRWA